MQRSLSQKYFHGHYILTWATLKGKKNAGSFSLLLTITMNVSHWRQSLLKYAQSVFPYLWLIIIKYFKHMLKEILLWRDSKQKPFARKITLLPRTTSCPQPRQRCGCSTIINSLLYTNTRMFFSLVSNFIPYLWRKLLAAQVGLKIPIMQSSTCFLKAQAAKTPWKKDHWDRL